MLVAIFHMFLTCQLALSIKPEASSSATCAGPSVGSALLQQSSASGGAKLTAVQEADTQKKLKEEAAKGAGAWVTLSEHEPDSAKLNSRSDRVRFLYGVSFATVSTGSQLLQKEFDLDCGFNSDCPQTYTVSEIEQMVRAQRINSDGHVQDLRALEAKMRGQCENSSTKMRDIVLTDGGWCYDEAEARLVSAKAGEVDQDFKIPPNHVPCDEGFASGLVDLMKRPDGSLYSLSDFGAGVGMYGHFLKAHMPRLEYHGYDGGGNVEKFTRGYTKFFDLTKPLSLQRTDWVFSSEVGEHIPNQFEAQVIANLHAHNCKGLILTWATLGQGGFHHVNCHSNEFVMRLFASLGYRYNDAMSQKLRGKVTSSSWLAHSTMVFERKAKPEGCV